jgi:hypothetical protein
VDTHLLPEFYLVPRGNLTSSFQLYLLGSEAQNNSIPPLKGIRSSELSIGGERKVFSSYKVFMAKVLTLASDLLPTNRPTTRLDVSEIMVQLYQRLHIVLITPRGREREIESLSWQAFKEDYEAYIKSLH